MEAECVVTTASAPTLVQAESVVVMVSAATLLKDEHMRRRRAGESLEAEVVSLFAPRPFCFTAAAWPTAASATAKSTSSNSSSTSTSFACTCAISACTSACSSFSSANSAFTFCMVKPPGARGQLEARR